MAPLGRMLLGRGELQPSARAELEAEGALLLEEGLRGHVTYRHWRAPGERSNLKREWLRGALVVTKRRLAVHGRSGPLVNVPWTDPRLDGLDLRVDGDGLLVGADAAAFSPDRSGRFEVVVRPADPPAALELIRGQAALWARERARSGPGGQD